MLEQKREAKKLPMLRGNVRLIISNPVESHVHARSLTCPKSRAGQYATVPHHGEKSNEEKDEQAVLEYGSLTNQAEVTHIAIPKRIPSKVSRKENGYVTAYAANTSPGLFRLVLHSVVSLLRIV